MKRVSKQIVIALAICGVALYAADKAEWIAPFSIGCFIGVVYWVLTGRWLIRIALPETSQKRKSLRMGSLSRIVLVFGSLTAAARLSEDFFWPMVIGLFFAFGLTLVNVIVYSLRENANQKK